MAWRGSAGASTGTGASTFSITVSGIGGVGPQSGDVVILTGIATSSTSGTPFTTTCPGFSTIIGPTQLTSSNCTQFALIKTAGSSEPASYTITVSGTGSGSATWAVQCNCFTGRSGSVTASSVAPVVFTGTPLSIACPTITPAA